MKPCLHFCTENTLNIKHVGLLTSPFFYIKYLFFIRLCKLNMFLFLFPGKYHSGSWLSQADLFSISRFVSHHPQSVYVSLFLVFVSYWRHLLAVIEQCMNHCSDICSGCVLQVRRMVGALVAVGQGRLSLPQLKEILEARDNMAYPQGFTAPAQGLFLTRVDYRAAGEGAKLRNPRRRKHF